MTVLKRQRELVYGSTTTTKGLDTLYVFTLNPQPCMLSCDCYPSGSPVYRSLHLHIATCKQKILIKLQMQQNTPALAEYNEESLGKIHESRKESPACL